MPQSLPPQVIFSDISNGIINNVKWNLAPKNSVSHAVNFVFDEVIGEAVVRQGTTILGSQLNGASNAITGLHYFSNSAGTISRLIAVADSGTNNLLKYYDGAAWQNGSLGSDTTGARTRFETFLDYVVRVNGTNSVLSSSDGINWASNTALADSAFPAAAKFVKVYKAQMTAAGSSTRPDSLYVSSVPNAAGTAISWTAGNREIVINPSDGQNITGLGVVGGVEVIFKDRAMYRWNNRSTDADQIVKVGCSSHESIVNCGSGLLAFFNPQGIYITTGEQPVLISRRIQKWIDNMNPAYYSLVAGYGDEEHLYQSLGNCTIDGKTYSNVVARYTVATKEWTVFSYAHQFRVFTTFINSSAPQIIGGDTTNRVLQIESDSNTDNGTNIGFQLESHDLDFGSRGIVKELCDQVIGFGFNPANVLIQVRVDSGDWITLGGLKKTVERFLINQKIAGHLLRFRVIGTSSANRFHFQGLECPKITFLDYTD